MTIYSFNILHNLHYLNIYNLTTTKPFNTRIESTVDMALQNVSINDIFPKNKNCKQVQQYIDVYITNYDLTKAFV